MAPFLPMVWGSVSACCRGSGKLSVLVLRPETKAELPVVPCRESQGLTALLDIVWDGVTPWRIESTCAYGNVCKITDGVETIFSP